MKIIEGEGYSGFKEPLLIRDRKTGGLARPPLVVCGRGNPVLGRETTQALGALICERNEFDASRIEELMAEIYDAPASQWPDGHRRISRIKSELTGRQVFIFNNPWPRPDERLMETLMMIDAVRSAGSASINVVLPYFAYGRDDKKIDARTPIGARVVAQMLQTIGANRIITLDLHAEQTTSTVWTPWDNLYASHMMIPALLAEIDPDNAIFMSTDTGGLKRVDAFNKRAKGKGIAFDLKARLLNADTSEPEAIAFIGDVEGRDVVILDDESVSLSSISIAAKAAAKNKARRIIAGVSHLKDARPEDNSDFPKMWESLNDLPPQFMKLITTDTVDHLPEIREHPLIKILPTADFFAEVVWRNFSGVSLSPDLID